MQKTVKFSDETVLRGDVRRFTSEKARELIARGLAVPAPRELRLGLNLEKFEGGR
jgi:hypothetical protein